MPTPSLTPVSEMTATPDPGSVSWAHQVGLLEPAELSWDELVVNAQAEGAVMLYSDSGRGLTALESLSRVVEGLTADGLVADSLDLYLQFQQDLARGEHRADVVLIADAARTWGLLQQHRLWTYLPADLREPLASAPVEGLLTHHWTAVAWVYNPALGTPALTSWWELTEPEWSGRVVLADPRASERSMNVLAALDQYASALALDYYQRYGRVISLDKDCPNAACQWFRSLLANDPLLMPGESEVAQAVGGEGVDTVRVGLCGVDILARVGGAPSVYPLPELQPFVGWMERTYIAVADQAPHPQAAKAAVRWLLGDPVCERGWSAWCLAGFYSFNSGIPDPEGLPPSRELIPRLMDLSPQYAAENMPAIEAWVTLQLIDRPLRYDTSG